MSTVGGQSSSFVGTSGYESNSRSMSVSPRTHQSVRSQYASVPVAYASQGLLPAQHQVNTFDRYFNQRVEHQPVQILQQPQATTEYQTIERRVPKTIMQTQVVPKTVQRSRQVPKVVSKQIQVPVQRMVSRPETPPKERMRVESWTERERQELLALARDPKAQQDVANAKQSKAHYVTEYQTQTIMETQTDVEYYDETVHETVQVPVTTEEVVYDQVAVVKQPIITTEYRTVPVEVPRMETIMQTVEAPVVMGQQMSSQWQQQPQGQYVSASIPYRPQGNIVSNTMAYTSQVNSKPQPQTQMPTRQGYLKTNAIANGGIISTAQSDVRFGQAPNQGQGTRASPLVELVSPELKPGLMRA